MNNLKSCTIIKDFLSKYPEKMHDTCILGLCVLGIELLQSTKINFSNYLTEKIISTSIPPVYKKLEKLKQELSRINKLLPNENESLPTSIASDSLGSTPEKKIMPPTPITVKRDSKSLGSKEEDPVNIIELADSFLNANLIKDIYQKEITAERLRTPFRKKWDDACRNIRSN